MTIKGKVVLIVDDVKDQRFLVKKILENVGITVMEAESVDAAFEMLDTKAPHLVLLDLVMAGKTGFDFLKHKGGYAALSSVPIVVVSSLTDKASIYRAIALGASDYLLKPFTAAHLMQKVRKHLKDTVFQVCQFKDGDMPSLTISLSAEITKLSSTSFSLETPIKIGAHTELHIESETLAQNDLSDNFFVSDMGPVVRAVSGFYSRKINIVGTKKVINSKTFKVED